MVLGQFNLGKPPVPSQRESERVSSKPKLNLLGQPIVSNEPQKGSVASQQAAVPLAQRGMTPTLSKLNMENKAIVDSLDSQSSPRSKAAKLMKRQAGIGQLTTRHVEEEPLI